MRQVRRSYITKDLQQYSNEFGLYSSRTKRPLISSQKVTCSRMTPEWQGKELEGLIQKWGTEWMYARRKSQGCTKVSSLDEGTLQFN